MNKLGKTLLVATALTPIFLICGLNSAIHERWLATKLYGGLFIALTVLFMFILYFILKSLPVQDLTTQKVKPADKEVLAFLLSYLLPFFNKDNTEFVGEMLTSVTIVVIIGLIIYHSSAYTFNPILALMGYHFYEVECSGMTYLLITRQQLIFTGK